MTLMSAYPNSSDVDVLIMGGSNSARTLLGELPASWVVYRYNEVDVRNFLFQIDFYVYFPHPDMIEAFGRGILEALALGCVTILPKHFESTFGEAAIYCDPSDVRDLIEGYYSDWQLFARQSHRAQDIVREKFGHASYSELISSLIGRDQAPDLSSI